VCASSYTMTSYIWLKFKKVLIFKNKKVGFPKNPEADGAYVQWSATRAAYLQSLAK